VDAGKNKTDASARRGRNFKRRKRSLYASSSNPAATQNQAMNAARTSCIGAFVTGQVRRVRSPLPYGSYKLLEYQRVWSRHLEWLGTGMTRPQAARLTLDLAEDLGYAIQPALYALDGDDVPKKELTQLCRNYDLKIAALLHQLEETLSLLYDKPQFPKRPPDCIPRIASVIAEGLEIMQRAINVARMLAKQHRSK
jgi:hypothetical protein